MAAMNHEQLDNEREEGMHEQEASCDQCTTALESCNNELALMKDRLQRLSADFENFKKRVERDRLSWTDTLEAEFIKELLPVVDDFDRAIDELQKSQLSPDESSRLTGFTLIAKALQKFLMTHNVQEITELTTFDPLFHEAVTMVAMPDHKSGEIIAVLQKGYKYKDAVLRPAKVAVAQ